MSNVNVVEAHSKSVAEIKAGLSQFEEMFAKYMVKMEWSGDRATLSGPVSGSIEIRSRELEVRIKLGMMAKAMGVNPEKLTGSIRRRLEEALA